MTKDGYTESFKSLEKGIDAEADYDLDATVSPEEAEELIRDAREFLQQAKAYLQILAAEPKK